MDTPQHLQKFVSVNRVVRSKENGKSSSSSTFGATFNSSTSNTQKTLTPPDYGRLKIENRLLRDTLKKSLIVLSQSDMSSKLDQILNDMQGPYQSSSMAYSQSWHKSQDDTDKVKKLET